MSLFFVSIGDATLPRVASAAVLLGAGIVSMHYVGIHGLAGNFAIQHDAGMVALSILIAVVTAYGGLRVFLARQDGVRLLISAVAFGVAVSGMHYTAMDGMHFVSAGAGHAHVGGLAASQQMLSLVVALLCFVIAAGFLLSLVPDPRRQTAVGRRAGCGNRPRARAGPGRAGPGGGDVAAAALGPLGRVGPASARAGAAAAGRGRRRHTLYRYRRRAQRPGGCTLYKGA